MWDGSGRWMTWMFLIEMALSLSFVRCLDVLGTYDTECDV